MVLLVAVSIGVGAVGIATSLADASRANGVTGEVARADVLVMAHD